MLLRIVLFLGIALVVAAGGAAGWQYWSSLPQADAAATVPAPSASPAAPQAADSAPAAPAEVAQQDWLITPGGGLVSRSEARAFLRQDRFLSDRIATFQFRAPLASLLSPGESLPAPVYHEAFAEVRAVALSAGLCPELVRKLAQGCKVMETRLVDGSYDPATASAEFLGLIAFTLKPDAVPLPDLATRVYRADYLALDRSVGAQATTPAAFLGAVADAAAEACAQNASAGTPCRINRLHVSWGGPGQGSASAGLGTLDPLPGGMYPAPPLF